MAPLRALKLLSIPSILILFVVTFFDSLVHYGHFFWTGRFLLHLGLKENYVPAVMSIGQVMEIAAMAVLGHFLKRLGWRTTMIIGILGQALRFGTYAIGTPADRLGPDPLRNDADPAAHDHEKPIDPRWSALKDLKLE